ncbi:MAG: aspartate 1-decarboxylase [Phycisphaeraceae bacterium]
MLRKMMLSKIHRATVTRCDPDYVGSITIDADLLVASGMRPNESVWVLDIDNAQRFETYIIRGAPGSGVIEVYGAAAKLTEVGHKVIILTYGLLNEQEIEGHEANVVLCDANNRVDQLLKYHSDVDQEAVL